MALLELLAQPETIAVIVLCLTILAIIHKRLNATSSLPLPPGPPKDSWIFGNSIPTALYVNFSGRIFNCGSPVSSAYRKFEEWTQEYGPVFSLRQGTNTIIVVGRMQAAIDIMEREGAALVDRPLSISAGETLSGGMRVLLTPAGERFKRMRR